MMKQRESEMRPAEEVAREMVSGPEYRDILGAVDWTVCVGVEPDQGVLYFQTRGNAQEASYVLRMEFAAAITRAREEGAAAERARQQPADVALYPAPDVPGQWIAHHVTRDLVTQGDSEPHALIMLAEAIETMDGTPAQPRDLAGRIRALIQEKAGRWAEEQDSERATRLLGTLGFLRIVLQRTMRGEPTERETLDRMRGYGAPYAKAADELEAIVRECARTT